MKRYVAGFLFDKDGECVALVRKNRPTWQAGFWNGIGGSIEAGEMPVQAMHREFWEEAGVEKASWRHFALLTGPTRDWEVYFYSAVGNPHDAVTMTDEEIRVFNLADLPREEMLVNLNWLIPMALYEYPGRGMPFFIQEH